MSENTTYTNDLLSDAEKFAIEEHEKLQRENEALKSEVERLTDLCFGAGLMKKSPCFKCGYNGPGYFQPDTHVCAAKHHEVKL